MSTTSATTATGMWTLADLVSRFGPIPAHRIRNQPPPGSATEDDLIDLLQRENRPCELVDETLVEKTVGLYESYLAMLLGRLMGGFVEQHRLGIVTGEAGPQRLRPGLVRIPDVAFFSWNRLPGGQIPRQAIPAIVPDLAIEVLSDSNTPQEMVRKLRDYFLAGVRRVWIVDGRDRTVRVYSSHDKSALFGENDLLNGEDVLPGFQLSVARLFADPAP